MIGALYVMIEGQEGGSYADLLDCARRAESLGYGGFFRSDHWLPIMSGPSRDATDAWATLAGLARETSRLRLGTMVSPMTFRHPSEYAKIVATVDQMSGGRVEAGFGAGWYAAEHAAYGIPFPPLRERFDRLEESLEVCMRLWADGEASFAGHYYRVENAPGMPKPTQRPRPPIIIGGKGPRRTPELVARYADELNTFVASLDEFIARRRQVVAACERAGRDPATVRFSISSGTVVGSDERDLRRRAERRMRHTGGTGDLETWMAELRTRAMLVGTAAQVVEQMRALRSTGCDRIYLQTVPIDDDGMLELIAAAVAPVI